MSATASPTVVVLARHGQTDSNNSGTISTQAPGHGLTEAGLEQAVELGRALVPRHPTAVYSSHLQRALQTARVVAEAVAVTPCIEEDLREIDAGALDGRSDAEAYAVLDEVLGRWACGDLEARIGTGENGRGLVVRVRALLQRWAREHPGATVVAVTHGGLIEIAVPHLAENLALSHGHGAHLPNGATVEVAIASNGTITCLKWAGQTVAPTEKRPVEDQGKDSRA